VLYRNTALCVYLYVSLYYVYLLKRASKGLKRALYLLKRVQKGLIPTQKGLIPTQKGIRAQKGLIPTQKGIRPFWVGIRPFWALMPFWVGMRVMVHTPWLKRALCPFEALLSHGVCTMTLIWVMSLMTSHGVCRALLSRYKALVSHVLNDRKSCLVWMRDVSCEHVTWVMSQKRHESFIETWVMTESRIS